jgi:hypothetical protein
LEAPKLLVAPLLDFLAADFLALDFVGAKSRVSRPPKDRVSQPPCQNCQNCTYTNIDFTSWPSLPKRAKSYTQVLAGACDRNQAKGLNGKRSRVRCYLVEIVLGGLTSVSRPYIVTRGRACETRSKAFENLGDFGDLGAVWTGEDQVFLYLSEYSLEPLEFRSC